MLQRVKPSIYCKAQTGSEGVIRENLFTFKDSLKYSIILTSKGKNLYSTINISNMYLQLERIGQNNSVYFLSKHLGFPGGKHIFNP